MSTSQVNWNSNIQFPSDSCFTLRVKDATFGPSKSTGNPMITLDWEVVAPDTYEIGGQIVVIAGVNATSYHTTAHFNADGSPDEAKTSNDEAKVFIGNSAVGQSLFEKFGLDGSQEDKSNPNVKQFIGKCVLAQMRGKSDPVRRTPTGAQIAAAKKAGKHPEGDIQKNPVTGKEIVKWKSEVTEIFGLAPEGAGSNKPY